MNLHAAMLTVMLTAAAAGGNASVGAAGGAAVRPAFPGTPRFDENAAAPAQGTVRLQTGQAAANQPAAQQSWTATLSSLRSSLR